MNLTVNAFNTKWVTTSGTGVIGATGQPVYLQGVIACGVSSQTVQFFSGAAAVTMAVVTFTGKMFQPFPMACEGGLTYQTSGNPGDSDLKLLFFWVPGIRT